MYILSQSPGWNILYQVGKKKKKKQSQLTMADEDYKSTVSSISRK